MAKQPRVLTGKVAAITGGARGIGKETARSFVREGMKVAIGDLDLELAKKTALELGPNVVAFPLNVTERPSFKQFLDDAEEALGPIDVLVNNAGIMQLGSFLEEDDATTQRQIDINVNGVLWGMKEILPRFLQRGTGHLVNVASTAGKGGFPGGATYCGTKHFVVGVSEAVRAEVKDTPIEVSCVMPVVVKTELASGLQPTRGVKHIEPQDVAEEIVRALHFPKFDVFVPRQVQAITTVMNVLPRRGREAIATALKADKVLAQRDDATRRAYELRASNSEPGLEPGAETKQLTEST
ncbi:SDR family oxidoreductase [Paraconexibacter algicola]|uniref:Short-chain dehydrogenase n=1 Tax=Paraconexibacter algicola TaxID=2133960 RepID=A0A2T4UIL7_9ACTN|nr:SDR family oxidoreductase [Paraconexibacter algicola]PTL59072.1 short-chain dehydrogenase [Paraconexibacter algicola]